MVGASVVGVRRRGKALMIDLTTKYTLVVHLKMTGQLVFVGEERYGAGHPNDSMINELPDKSTRVEITFADGSKLFFNDQRKFWLDEINANPGGPKPAFHAETWPRAPSDSFTSEDFIERIRKKKNSPVKGAILDQTVLAGVGNIYADESLFSSQIHPARRVHELKDEQLAMLLDEIKKVMNLSIEKGGSTDRNYVNAEGERGSYLEFAKVFKRGGEACVTDGSIVLKTRVASRGTHYCPTCQPAPANFVFKAVR